MKSTSLFFFFILNIFHFVNAQNYFGGSDIFRIGTEGSRFINRVQDEITIGLVSIELTKNKGIFKEESQAGVLIKAKVTGFDQKRMTQSSIIERLYIVDVEKYPSGSISLPLEGSIIESFKLSNGGITFTNIELEILLLKRNKDTDFGFVIKSLAKLTQTLTFPATPFNPVVSQLTGGLGSLLASENDQENKVKERIPVAKINMSFAPNSLFSQSTGIFSVIFGTDEVTSGFVNIQNSKNYDFKVEVNPKRAIMVKKKYEKENAYTELKNDNLTFYIDAYNTSRPEDAQLALNDQDGSIPNVDKVKKYESVTVFDTTGLSSRLKPEYNTVLKHAIDQVENTSSSKDSSEINIGAILINDYISAMQRRAILGLDLSKNKLPVPTNQTK